MLRYAASETEAEGVGGGAEGTAYGGVIIRNKTKYRIYSTYNHNLTGAEMCLLIILSQSDRLTF